MHVCCRHSSCGKEARLVAIALEERSGGSLPQPCQRAHLRQRRAASLLDLARRDLRAEPHARRRQREQLACPGLGLGSGSGLE